MMRDWPRHNVETFEGGGLRVDVYTRDDDAGRGVCMSVYADRREIMRFDLFDHPAHEHWNVGAAKRIFYPEQWSFDERLEWAMNSLVHNVRIPLGREVEKPPLAGLARSVEAAVRRKQEEPWTG